MRTKCEFQGCAKDHWSRGFCTTHYAAWRRGRLQVEARAARERAIRICEQCGGPIPPERRKGVMFCGPTCKRKAQYGRQKAYPTPKANPPCTVEGCATPIMARGMCQ